MRICFTYILFGSHDARFGSVNCHVSGALLWVEGLTSDAIRWCTLHVINLGYAGWVGASSMEYLLQKEHAKP